MCTMASWNRQAGPQGLDTVTAACPLVRYKREKQPNQFGGLHVTGAVLLDDLGGRTQAMARPQHAQHAVISESATQ
jgi:hypothetical protein